MAISLILASSAACGLASSRRLAWIFVLAALALLAAFLAFPERNDPALAGDEAYRRGDYARAWQNISRRPGKAPTPSA